jgi:SH3 domain protein
MTVRLTAALLLCACLPTALFAQSAWVSDEFEITLRTGPSTGNAIERMLSSGTPLTVLERDADSGYSRVRTNAGTEGWVLTRYLMSEPSAREQLETLSAQLSSAAAEGSSLNTQLDGIRGEYEAARQQIETLTREKARVESELADIRRTAADVLSINELNAALQSRLATAEARIGSLEQENSELRNDALRMWFLTGAGVLLFGMLLGLWLPKIRWQRRSRYDRF